MPQTIRIFWPDPFNGHRKLNFNWPDVDSDSVVAVTASEYAREDPPHPGMKRFVGDATVRVDDVAPHGPPFDANNGVTFVVMVDWEDPLFIATDITLFDAKPVITQD